MNITQTHLINEATSVIHADMSVGGISGFRAGDGSVLGEKIAAGNAAREYFQETASQHSELMSRSVKVVSPEVKAAVLNWKNSELEETKAGNSGFKSQRILDLELFIEAVEADKFSEESLKALLSTRI